MVSGTFFSGLGVKLPLGRGFTEQDEANHAPLAVISYNYWTRRFARNPNVLGKRFTSTACLSPSSASPPRDSRAWKLAGRPTSGFPCRIAVNSMPGAILPKMAKLTSQIRLGGACVSSRASLPASPELRHCPTAANISAVRLCRPGLAHAGEKPPMLSFMDAKSFPGYDEMYGNPLRMLMAMVGLVLLIALTNVVMLLVARNAARQREFSVRQALGAGRGELFRQLLAESLILVTAGGVLAWAFADGGHAPAGNWAQIESSLAPDRPFCCSPWVFCCLRLCCLAGAHARRARWPRGTGDQNIGGHIQRRCRQIAHRQNHRRFADGDVRCAARRRGPADSHPAQFENTPLGMRVDGLVVFGVNPDIPSVPAGVHFIRT